jgi:hypothetical protein
MRNNHLGTGNEILYLVNSEQVNLKSEIDRFWPNWFCSAKLRDSSLGFFPKEMLKNLQLIRYGRLKMSDK